MINLRVTDASDGLLTLVKPLGKAIPLVIGDIVNAEVAEVLPSGLVTLKLGGSHIAAQTEVALQQGSTVQLRVMGADSAGREVRLQFVGFEQQHPETIQTNGPQFQQKAAEIQGLLEELSTQLEKMTTPTSRGGSPSVPTPSSQAASLEIIERLIKTLPNDTQSLPKAIRLQLHNLLQQSLASAGKDIKGRLQRLLPELPENLDTAKPLDRLQKDLSLSIERLESGQLKTALLDTGVTLEAKLKALAEALQSMKLADEAATLTSDVELPDLETKDLQQQAHQAKGDLAQLNAPSREVDLECRGNQTEAKGKGDPVPARAAESTAARPASQQVAVSSRLQEIAQKDLKAALLALRQQLVQKSQNDSGWGSLSRVFAQSGGADRSDGLSAKALIGTVEGLIRDIETFQLLSKTTESLYTYLPVSWQELKEGEIAFKRESDPQEGPAYSCWLNLNLEHFGKLSIVVLMQRQSFFVTFRADHPGLQAALSISASDLQKNFCDKGMALRAVNVTDGNNPPAGADTVELPVTRLNLKV